MRLIILLCKFKFCTIDAVILTYTYFSPFMFCSSWYLDHIYSITFRTNIEICSFEKTGWTVRSIIFEIMLLQFIAYSFGMVAAGAGFDAFAVLGTGGLCNDRFHKIVDIIFRQNLHHIYSLAVCTGSGHLALLGTVGFFGNDMLTIDVGCHFYRFCRFCAAAGTGTLQYTLFNTGRGF